MKIQINPSKVSGTVTAPASKSAMQRACAAALIKGGNTILKNPGISADDKAALNIIEQLGASVLIKDNEIVINSNGIQPVSGNIDCGESGLSARMFTSIAAVSTLPIIINGKGSLVKRPLTFFDEVLPALGVKIESNRGLLPLKIKGPLTPGDIEIDGSLSSQFLTGLLFAYAAAGASDKTITVKELNSKPYVDLTLKLMSDFGLKTPVHSNYSSFYFGSQSISSFPNEKIQYEVEGDWSGAAFLLVAGAIAGNVTVKGLDVFSTQADKQILQALMQTEAFMGIETGQVQTRQNSLQPFHFNATDCPDLFPPLVALAAACEGTSVIEGVHRLTHKESNRALTLQEEFGKMGLSIELQDDQMIIRNESGLKGALVNSHHDHRIAMACAVAALIAEGETIIENAEAVNKSYPAFWDHLKKINAGLFFK
jgi:3-phosphoshikimate 1-carboxyvinyltransferase